MPESKSLTTLDRRQRLLLAAICGLIFSESLVMTIVAPLLPITAKEKGVSYFEIGIIFGSAWAASALAGLLHGKLLTRITPKAMCIGGTVLTALSSIGLGIAGQLSRDRTEFLPSVLVLRLLSGVGFSAIAVAAQSILSAELPEHSLGAQAAYQGSVALGFTLSPPIAGGLYAADGFWLPFVVMSVILLIIIGIVTIPLRNLKGENTHRESGHYFPLLLQPRAMLTVVHSLVIAAVFRFFEGFIPLHMNKEYGWGPVEVAWLFTVCAVIFIASLPIWVKLNTAVMGNVCVMATCMFLSAITMLIMGPAPFIPLKYSWWATCLVCVMYVITYTGAIVTNIPDLNLVAEKSGYPDNYGTYGIVSASVNGALTAGFFSGPFIGGAISDSIGFSWTAVVFGFIQIAVGFLLLTRLLVDKFIGHKSGTTVLTRQLSSQLAKAGIETPLEPSEMINLGGAEHPVYTSDKCNGHALDNMAFEEGPLPLEKPMDISPGKSTNETSAETESRDHAESGDQNEPRDESDSVTPDTLEREKNR